MTRMDAWCNSRSWHFRKCSIFRGLCARVKTLAPLSSIRKEAFGLRFIHREIKWHDAHAETWQFFTNATGLSRPEMLQLRATYLKRVQRAMALGDGATRQSYAAKSAEIRADRRGKDYRDLGGLHFDTPHHKRRKGMGRAAR